MNNNALIFVGSEFRNTLYITYAARFTQLCIKKVQRECLSAIVMFFEFSRVRLVFSV